METGTCPILTRYVTDLYSTIPSEFAEVVQSQDIQNVPIEDVYVTTRMLLCADFCSRHLLPLVLSAPELKKSNAYLGKLRVTDLDALIEVHTYLNTKLYKRLNNLIVRGKKADRARWLFIDGVAHSVQWVIEAAMSGSAVIGPLTVNVMDTIAGELGWETMFPYAQQIMDDLTKVQFYVN